MTTETVPAPQVSPPETVSTGDLASAFASKVAVDQQAAGDTSRPGDNGAGGTGTSAVQSQTAGGSPPSQPAPGATTGKTVDAGSDPNAPANPGKTAPVSADVSADNPLAGLTIEALLKDPVLGGQIQSWSDKAFAAQASALREKVKQELVPEVRASVEDESTDAYLKSLDPEERADVISADPDLAIRWGKIQEAEKAQASKTALNPDAVNAAAMTYSAQLQIGANMELLKQPYLTDEDRAALAPEKFTERGWEGLQDWSKQLFTRVVERQATAQMNARFATEWESYKVDRAARESGTRPGLIAAGTNAAPLPDLMENNSNQLLSSAFEHKRASGR